MKFAILPLLILATTALAQQGSAPSAGRQKVEAAYTYQAQLADSTITIDEVIANWKDVAADKDVRKDADALAIALGSEGLLELQKGEKAAGDSLLALAVPKFRLKHSKAYFLVAFAEVDRELKHHARALKSYEEILSTMDSMPELWDIEFYRLSGYAPYAYAINAALGVARIAKADAKLRTQAVALLQTTLDRHPDDARGLMALIGLHHAAALKTADYKFKLDLLCSRKPELRKVGEKFENELGSVTK